MGKRSGKGRAGKGFRNAVSLAGITFVVSLLFAGPVNAAISRVEFLLAILILVGVIVIAVVADVLGVAATAADEAPFHAMASDRVMGAKEAVMIVRNGAHVNSICSDVIGDVCGTISGAVGAALVLDLRVVFPNIPLSVTSVLVLGTIAAVTVGAKAWTKGFAVHNAKTIVGFTGRVFAAFKKITSKRPRRDPST